MKIASIAGITCSTTDIQRTKDFYESLGFRTDKLTDDGITALINWFWIRFHLKNTYETQSTNAINMKVDDVAEFYQKARTINAIIVNELANKPWGVQEFTIADPDQNLLTFFEKK